MRLPLVIAFTLALLPPLRSQTAVSEPKREERDKAHQQVEKAQKKELEVQAKALIAEAKGLENSGQLVAARTKYTESQPLLEMNEAADAIKHLDDERLQALVHREYAADSLLGGLQKGVISLGFLKIEFQIFRLALL